MVRNASLDLVSGSASRVRTAAFIALFGATPSEALSVPSRHAATLNADVSTILAGAREGHPASARLSTDRPANTTVGRTPMNQTQMLEYIDSRMGIPQHRAPFPMGWRYDTNPNDKLVLTGPNGVKVFQSGSGLFFHSDDGFARQSAQSRGQRLAAPMPLSRFIDQQFAPYMAQRGYRLVRQAPLPKVTRFMELFAAGMPQGLTEKRYEVVGAEWEGRDGTRAFTRLTKMVLLPGRGQGQPYTTWEVTTMELYAANEHYAGARDAFIHASENTEVNPQWQIAMNKQHLASIRASMQYWDQRTRESHIQHVGRMNAILARSQASSNVASINSEILDISHSGFLKRSDMVAAGQARTVDMIAGTSVIANPGTGEHYRVDAGSNHYWVNGNGQYFRTDNALYDPRTDKRINDQRWERFDVVR